MLFSSIIFIFLFLPIVLFGYYVIFHSKPARNCFLFLASLFFYAWGEPKFVLVMIASIFLNTLWGVLADKYRIQRRKAYAVIGCMLASNLLILFIFKYLNFTLHNINRVWPGTFPQSQIQLPIGISFFTFQAISYVIDVYRGKGGVQRNPLYVGLYIALFPQLIAGPIVRYETVAEQLFNRRENLEDFSQGMCRFIVGLSKKVLLSNTLALVSDKAFALNLTNELSVSFAWLGAIAYTFQIFFDFSGYSDMAIGLGRMFGFHFEENFVYPYVSASVSEFWRRWHISMGTWFRDYVYFPLGGSRVKTKARLILNLFVVWLLTGIWHGAKWNFIAWGLFYFVLITFEKMTGLPQKLKSKFFRTAYRVFTVLCIIAGWVLFRAEGMDAALHYGLSMARLTGNVLFDELTILYLRENFVFFLCASLCSFPIVPWLNQKLYGTKYLRTFCIIMYPIVFTGIFSVCISYLVKGVYNPFIYFNF